MRIEPHVSGRRKSLLASGSGRTAPRVRPTGREVAVRARLAAGFRGTGIYLSGRYLPKMPIRRNVSDSPIRFFYGCWIFCLRFFSVSSLKMEPALLWTRPWLTACSHKNVSNVCAALLPLTKLSDPMPQTPRIHSCSHQAARSPARRVYVPAMKMLCEHARNVSTKSAAVWIAC